MFLRYESHLICSYKHFFSKNVTDTLSQSNILQTVLNIRPSNRWTDESVAALITHLTQGVQ